jgi:hypothetical protein
VLARLWAEHRDNAQRRLSEFLKGIAHPAAWECVWSDRLLLPVIRNELVRSSFDQALFSMGPDRDGIVKPQYRFRRASNPCLLQGGFLCGSSERQLAYGKASSP